MSGGHYIAPPTDPLQPAGDLAALLKRELAVEITPEQIVEMFKGHWHKLSVLAHHIHGALPR